MIPTQQVITRAQATLSVATAIQSAWAWPVLSVAEMGSTLATIRAKVVTAGAADVDENHVRQLLDQELDGYRRQTRDFLRLARLRHRGDRVNLALLRGLRLRGNARQQALDVGRTVEDVWTKINAAWVPMPGLTFVAMHDCGIRCQQFLIQYTDKQTALRKQVEELQAQADAMDQWCVEWYATATRVFPAGTVYGDLIRTMVPTSGGVADVGAAVIDSITSPGSGRVDLIYHAPHATSYDLWHKGPGDAAFVKLAEGVTTLTYSVLNLAAGVHQFKVVGRNSTGEGAASAESSVTVAQSAVA